MLCTRASRFSALRGPVCLLCVFPYTRDSCSGDMSIPLPLGIAIEQGIEAALRLDPTRSGHTETVRAA